MAEPVSDGETASPDWTGRPGKKADEVEGPLKCGLYVSCVCMLGIEKAGVARRETCPGCLGKGFI